MGGGGVGEKTHELEKNEKMLEKINTIIMPGVTEDKTGLRQAQAQHIQHQVQ